MLAVLIEYSGSAQHVVRHFIWGLAFSAVGDGCLVFPEIGLFVPGLISFAISLCFYISALGLVESLQDISYVGVLCGLCTLSLSSGILLVFKNRMIPQRLKPLAKIVLIVLIVMYFMILSVLLWSSTLLFLRQTYVVGTCSMIGAAMFYTSDMLIAAGAIWDFTLLQGRWLVMTTYYSAQLLLAISMLLRT